MSDFVIVIDRFVLRASETNKAHALGFHKWTLSYVHKGFENYPETLQSSGTRYMTLDVALTQVVDAYHSEVGAPLYDCQVCKKATRHIVQSVDLNQDASFLLVNYRCSQCHTDRTEGYKCRVIGGS